VEFIDQVSSAATADVVDGSGVLAETLLLGKFLVEREHSAFLLAVHVACSTAARGVEGVGWRRSELDQRGWTGGIRARGHVLWVDASGITGTATSRIVVVGGRDGWVRLGDVVGRHFELLGFVLLMVVDVGRWC